MAKIVGVHTAGVPVGATKPFSGSTVPTNFLLCDGSAVSRTTYASLFAVIGTIYGSGDGSTTFNLPDLRGIFPKGAGSQTIGSKTYSGTLGVKQNDATAPNGLGATQAAHQHIYQIGSASSGLGAYGQYTSGGANPQAYVGGTAATYGWYTNSVTPGITLSGDAETRPASLAVNYIIAYK